MQRDVLIHLPVVLAVARRGGFAAAASELGMSPSAVSHAVRLVEDRLGLPLFARTTRSVALTEAGAALVAAARPALADLGEAIERLRAARGEVVGTLRLNAPRLAQSLVLTPLLAELARRHPQLVVEVTADDGLVDIVAAGYDAGIRLGAMIAQDMVAIRLCAPLEAVLVAAPDYLAARGEPRSLAELSAHNCIGYRLLAGGGLYAWELRDEAGADVALEVSGSAIVTDANYAKDLALAGVGIAYLFEPLVRKEIAAGRLRRLLPASAIEEPGLFLYYPQRASLSPKLRAFVDIARETLRATRSPTNGTAATNA